MSIFAALPVEDLSSNWCWVLPASCHGTVPCIPVPDRVYQKVVEAMALRPFGYTCFILGTMRGINLEVFRRFQAGGERENKDGFINNLARAWFTGCHVGLVRKAWRYFSMAMVLYPFDYRWQTSSEFTSSRRTGPKTSCQVFSRSSKQRNGFAKTR